jgi:hypothetical protein
MIDADVQQRALQERAAPGPRELGARSRISVASLHSLPPARVIGPAPELVDDEKNPRRYMDTDFATFLDYLSSAEGKHKSFLQTRRIPSSS